jgi:hypothetical protein
VPGARAEAGAGGAPTLFLLVDAIPWDLAREAWDGGALPGFAAPRPVVSVFPSLTEVAVPALLREIFPARPPGYEARWYHPPSGAVRGPGDASHADALAPFHTWPHGLVADAAMYLLRGHLAGAQARWIGSRYRREGGPWLGYVSATDGVAHFEGRAGLARALREIAAEVHQAREDHARRHGVLPDAVLCSDHGMAFGPVRHLAARELGERLEGAGFRVGEPGPDGAVLVPFGDVGAGCVHVGARRARDAAGVAAEAPGVDLAFAREEDGFLALGDGGAARARVRFRGDAVRYDAEAGDPLGLEPVFHWLSRAGRLRGGFAADADLLAATWDHALPDACARVRRGLGDLVRYPAAVLFSMRDDASYGPALTHLATRVLGGLRGNHGALSAAQSLGFAAVACDGAARREPWPGAPALRPEEVFRPWAALVRAGAEPAGG